MPPNNRWRVQGVDRKTRRLARQAAARSGMTVGEWIDKAIINHGGLAPRGQTAPLVPAEFVRSARISGPAGEEMDPPVETVTEESPETTVSDDDAPAIPAADIAVDAETEAETVPDAPPELETQPTADPIAPEIEALAENAPEPEPEPETQPDEAPVSENQSESELESGPESGPESEPPPEPETPPASSVPISVNPADRPVPSTPVEPAMAAAATEATRRLDPRVYGGIAAVVLLAGGYWLWSDNAVDLTPPPTPGAETVAEAPPAAPAPVENLSLANDLENAASRLPLTPFERMAAAAKDGDPKAQHDLAIMYLRGNGVPTDHAQAAIWLEKSAGAGIPKAQYNLGLLYEKGLGVTQNYGTAFLWYQRAARQGHTRAQHNLGTLYAVGKGTKQNFAEAARWFTRASKEGLAEAHYSLGLLYEKGLGVTSDPRKAAAFYRSALAAGSAQAAEKLTRLEPALRELPPRRDSTLVARATPAKKPSAPPPKTQTLSPAGIINMQRLLTKLDLAPGPADGVLGKKTVEAIKLYQRFAGLPVDGKPTRDLLKDLRQVVGAMSPGSTN